MVFSVDIIEAEYNVIVTVKRPRKPYTSGVQPGLTVLDKSWSNNPTSMTVERHQIREYLEEGLGGTGVSDGRAQAQTGDGSGVVPMKEKREVDAQEAIN